MFNRPAFLALLPVILMGASAPAGCEGPQFPEFSTTADDTASTESIRVFGECPEDVIDIPIGWTVTRVTVYGVEPLGGNDYTETEMDIDTWEQDRFTVSVICPSTGSQVWEWRSINVWVEAP